MTTLLFPLTSLRIYLPPCVMLGVAPHFFSASCILRACRGIRISNEYIEKIDGFMYSTYQSMVAYFFEEYSGVQVIFYGDQIPTDKCENVLYISNHQSSADWALVDFIGVRQGSLGRIRYVIKESLKYLPFYGPYFKMHDCVFVKRDGSKSQEEKLNNTIEKFEERRTEGFWLTLFPEGTRYVASKKIIIEKSKLVAKKEGYEPFENVLFPRTKGFELCIENLKHLDAIYDFTIGFKVPWLTARPKEQGPSPLEMLSLPGREIHMYFKRIPVKDLPKDRAAVRSWLHERFKEKDELLNYFYAEKTNGSFPGQSYFIPVKSRKTMPSVCFYTCLLALSLFTKTGRDIYWKMTLFGLAVSISSPIIYRFNLI